MSTKSRISENPQPVRFDEVEAAIIENIQRGAAGRKLSVSFIAKRALRYAGPKFLSGEVPIVESVTLAPARK